MKQTILSMLDSAIEKFGDFPYLADKKDTGWEKISYIESKARARKIAASLLSRGFSKNDCFTIISEGRSEWVLSELAALMIGGISVPLSLKLLPEEIPFRVNHSESKIVFFSHITFAKIIDVIDKFENDILFVCLDCKKEIVDYFKNNDKIPEDRFACFDQLLHEGNSFLDEQEKKLNQLIHESNEDDTVTICYTSGTTGNPKGIMLTHKNYWANCHGGAEIIGLPPKISTLVILPIDHSFAHTVALYASYILGITLYFVDARNGGGSILRNIPINLKETNPYFLLTVPALTGNFMKKMKAGVKAKGGFIADLFEKGLKAGIAYHGNGFEKSKRPKGMFAYRLSQILIYPKLKRVFGNNIHLCIGGGALLDIKQQQFFNAIGVPVYQGYGLTEATPIISTNTELKHKFGTSGVILNNINLKIVDDNGTETPKGMKGEIIINGDNVMKGYIKNQSATKETLKNGWLHTGDLGFIDKDNFLVVTGRAKALLISADGEKYSPEEIEETVQNSQELIAQIMLYCDHKNYTTCLLTLDISVVKANKYSNEKELLADIWKSLNSWKEDTQLANKFPSQWVPTSFGLLTEQFSEENHMINSTMKMVRYKIAEVYMDKLNYLYSSEGSKWDNSQNRETASMLLK